MNVLLRIGLGITCMVLIVSALLIVLVGLLRATSPPAPALFGELEEDDMC